MVNYIRFVDLLAFHTLNICSTFSSHLITRMKHYFAVKLLRVPTSANSKATRFGFRGVITLLTHRIIIRRTFEYKSKNDSSQSD